MLTAVLNHLVGQVQTHHLDPLVVKDQVKQVYQEMTRQVLV